MVTGPSAGPYVATGPAVRSRLYAVLEARGPDLTGTPIPTDASFNLNGIVASDGGRTLLTIHFATGRRRPPFTVSALRAPAGVVAAWGPRR